MAVIVIALVAPPTQRILLPDLPAVARTYRNVLDDALFLTHVASFLILAVVAGTYAHRIRTASRTASVVGGFLVSTALFLVQLLVEYAVLKPSLCNVELTQYRPSGFFMQDLGLMFLGTPCTGGPSGFVMRQTAALLYAVVFVRAMDPDLTVHETIKQAPNLSLLVGLLALFSTFVAIERVVVGAHHIWDVAVGVAFGELLFWWFLIAFHLSIRRGSAELQLAEDIVVPGLLMTFGLIYLSRSPAIPFAFLLFWLVAVSALHAWRSGVTVNSE